MSLCKVKRIIGLLQNLFCCHYWWAVFQLISNKLAHVVYTRRSSNILKVGTSLLQLVLILYLNIAIRSSITLAYSRTSFCPIVINYVCIFLKLLLICVFLTLSLQTFQLIIIQWGHKNALVLLILLTDCQYIAIRGYSIDLATCLATHHFIVGNDDLTRFI